MKTYLQRAILLSWLVACLSLVVIPAANAYIDPGSGSFIFQMLVGAALGATFGIKLFWRRIRSFFSRSSSEEE